MTALCVSSYTFVRLAITKIFLTAFERSEKVGKNIFKWGPVAQMYNYLPRTQSSFYAISKPETHLNLARILTK